MKFVRNIEVCKSQKTFMRQVALARETEPQYLISVSAFHGGLKAISDSIVDPPEYHMM